MSKQRNAPAARCGPSIDARWKPTRTRVFAVGLLEYDDGIHWSLETRRDVVLLDALRDRGVPAKNIVFLHDAEATTSGFENALLGSLARSRADEQLIFYFAGHGSRDRTHGTGTFVLRDGRLPVPQVFTWIERSFRGAMAILTADCCYSGSLPLEAPLRAGRVAYAALGSSLSTLPSTGAWTFTNCWIDAIEGRVLVDFDGDGVLRIDELARYAELRLSFFDGQVSSFAVANGFPSTFELGPATTRSHPRHGDLVEARGKYRRWHRAEILEARDDAFVVRWAVGGSQSVVQGKHVRPWQPTAIAPGTVISVRHAKKWYAATVLAARHGMHLVRYEDWDASWDEWVAPDRIKQGKRAARV